MQNIPNEILYEIASHLNPKVPQDKVSLKRMRLVSRTFNTFATRVLFRTFDTFFFGHNLEDTRERIKTLASSDLRRNIDRLKVRFYKSGLSPEQGVGHQTGEDSSLLIDRAIWQDFKRELMQLLKEFHGALQKPLRRISLLPRGFPDEGACPDAYVDKLNEEQSLWEIERTCFLGTLSDFVREFAAGDVDSLKIAVYPSDLRFFLGAGTDKHSYRVPEATDQHLQECMLPFVRCLKHIEIIFLRVKGYMVYGHNTRIEICEDDFIVIGDLLHKSKASSLCLRVPYCARRFMSLNHKGVSPPPEFQFEALEKICLSGRFRFNDPQIFTELIQSCPNLTTLELLSAGSIRARTWGEKFKILTQHSPKLHTIFFESLRYNGFDWDVFNASHNWLVLDESTGKSYRKPLLTVYQHDIDQFNKLRQIVEERRKKLGLEKDQWLSSFCLRQYVVQKLHNPELGNVE